MTDPTSDTTHTPVPVEPSVSKVQGAALLRQVALALGVILPAFGIAKATGYLSIIATQADSIVAVISGAVAIGALVWGQIRTRVDAKRWLAVEKKVSDKVAYLKGK